MNVGHLSHPHALAKNQREFPGLGVWVSAYHLRLRSMLESRGRGNERIPPLPVIQVYSCYWSVLFAIDTGLETVS